MKIIRKSEHYSLEKVNQRIAYYTENQKLITDEFKKVINQKLLSFWTNYKLKNYSDA